MQSRCADRTTNFERIGTSLRLGASVRVMGLRPLLSYKMHLTNAVPSYSKNSTAAAAAAAAAAAMHSTMPACTR